MTNEYYEAEARKKLLLGAERLYKAVRTTLGPRGRNAIIKPLNRQPITTHDGVTVARYVNPIDPTENAGAEIMKEACEKMNAIVGDATTTVAVLTYHILKESERLIKRGANPMILAKEVEDALEEVIDDLNGLRRPADDIKTLTDIATLSSRDEQIGKIIAETVYKLGVDGTLEVKPTPRPDTIAELIEGIYIDGGYMSPQMITDSVKMEAVYDDVAVVVIDRKIHSFMEILPVLGVIDKANIKQAVIIAEDMAGDTIPNLVLNSTQGVFRTLAIKSPSFGDNQRTLLDDIAAATGATVISKDTIGIDEVTIEHIGRAKRVIAKQNKTTIIGAKGDIKDRMKLINGLIDESTDDYEKSKLEKRRANLAGKVGIIYVGGQTETEIEKRIFDVDDAVGTTMVALKDGIIQGGGIPLYKARITSKTNGAKLLSRALKQPFKQLVENSGMNVRKCEKAIKHTPNNIGFNVRTGQLVDLLDEGIIDAYGATKQALTTAVSLGVADMTAGVLVVETE